MISRAALDKGATVVLSGLAVAILGIAIVGQFNPVPLRNPRLVPAPYRTAKYPGGTALRLAMVHDVLHERYLRHGSAWYEARNAKARAVIGERPEPTDAVFAAMDDLAVGLERTGHADQAVEVMRQKLALLPGLTRRKAGSIQFASSEDEVEAVSKAPPLGTVDEQYYTAHANLGTALIHLAIGPAMTGDPAAKVRLQEGLSHIQQAIAINPAAHFGRERWQAIAVQHILTAIDQPAFWTQYTLCGDPLESPYPSRTDPWWQRVVAKLDPTTPLTGEQRSALRSGIPRIGVDPKWTEAVGSPYTTAVPFDEPLLGLIGMWTMGGGPNPYSAMTMGVVMERVQQSQIAFNGYERALEMQERLGPSADIRKALVAFCTDRQEAIAKKHSPADPQGWIAKMRELHQKELGWGQQYQREYQEYEAKQIAAGVALDDPTFYQGFLSGRASIASDPGLADDVYISDRMGKSVEDHVPLVTFLGGLGMMFGAMWPTKAKKD